RKKVRAAPSWLGSLSGAGSVATKSRVLRTPGGRVSWVLGAGGLRWLACAVALATIVVPFEGSVITWTARARQRPGRYFFGSAHAAMPSSASFSFLAMNACRACTEIKRRLPTLNVLI